MNHDAVHCLDYAEECLKNCYRAKLIQDLRNFKYPWPAAWEALKGTNRCPKWPEKNGKTRRELNEIDKG